MVSLSKGASSHLFLNNCTGLGCYMLPGLPVGTRGCSLWGALGLHMSFTPTVDLRLRARGSSVLGFWYSKARL